MKKILLAAAIIIISGNAVAQSVSININGAPADTSAMLDISANPAVPKGILIPRMRSTERTAIYAPANGLLVYDINTFSFWYCSFGVWKEIPNTTTQFPPSGLASGDLYGSYPSPNVGKIQNLDIAFGVPFDKQVLKWDALNNKWQGLNDSLFLPYNVTFGSPTKLFGITNTNSTAGSSAIYGKSSNVGSGAVPSLTAGVWGDNSTGFGVYGSSDNNAGLYGYSQQNSGVYGYSASNNFAGVYGTNENDGNGVMGEVQSSNSGTAIYGKVNGGGIAGRFTSLNLAHTDTTLVVSTNGLGVLSSFSSYNSSSTKTAIDILNGGNGKGISLWQYNSAGIANALDAINEGSGVAVYGRSRLGISAKFENTNVLNTSNIAEVNTNAVGTALSVNSTYNGQNSNAVEINTTGTGIGLGVYVTKGRVAHFSVSDVTAPNEAIYVGQNGIGINSIFSVNNASNSSQGILLNHAGTGRGMEINLTKATNTNAGLYVNTLGNKGVEVLSAGVFGVTATATGNAAVAINGNTGQTANNAIGVKGTTGANVSNGIGVLGQAGVNDINGIGVKGIAGGGIAGGIGVLGEGSSSNPQAIGVKGTSYTHNEDVGAVTGINFTDGVGVYGESTGFDGIGVAGTVGNTSNHSVAAVFTNKYSNNNRSVMELISNGKGNSIFSDNTNLSNTSPIFRIKNAGTGDFLRFETNLGSIVSTVSKTGNINTIGTVTVKGDKGIIRNSSGTQLRMEDREVSFAASHINHYDDGGFNFVLTVPVTFDNAFSTAPSVYIGSIVTGGIEGLTLKIVNVTTTGCDVRLSNYTSSDFSYNFTVVKIVAIGPE